METNIDTRSLPEIWSSLCESDQAELRYTICKNCKITEAALRNWRRGVRRPDALHQDVIAASIKKVCKINVKPQFLFPR